LAIAVSEGVNQATGISCPRPFLGDLFKEWKRSGPKCLQRLAETEPGRFAKLVGDVLPRALQVEALVNVEHTHKSEFDAALADFTTAYRLWGSKIGADRKLIELRAERDQAQEEVDEH